MDIIKKVTKDAERLLKSLRAKYYIELPTGEQIWHDLDGYELVPAQAEEKPQRKKREMRSGREYGELTAYFRPFLEKCAKVGDVVEIPTSKYDLHELHAAVSAYCSVHWGKGTYRSITNKVKGQVEVMRTSPTTVVKKDKVQAESKVNVNGNGALTQGKFRSVGHGMDALQNLKFDDEEHQQR